MTGPRGSWMFRGRRLDGIRHEIVSEAAEQRLRRRDRDAPIYVGGEMFTPDRRRVAELGEFEKVALLEQQDEERRLEALPVSSPKWR